MFIGKSDWKVLNKKPLCCCWVVILLIYFPLAVYYWKGRWEFGEPFNKLTITVPTITCIANKYYIQITFKKHLLQTKNKTILLWTRFFGDSEYRFGRYSAPFFICNEKIRCQTTSDRSLLNQSDAVVFHIDPTDWNVNDKPDIRMPHQRWIFFLFESPERTAFNLTVLPDFFNWTMTYRWFKLILFLIDSKCKNITYRLDSDVHAPYGTVELVKRISDLKWKGDYWRKLPARKKKKVAWFVSNCKTPGRREDFIDQLRNHIQVDIYGQCGEFKCSRGTDQCCEYINTANYR